MGYDSVSALGITPTHGFSSGVPRRKKYAKRSVIDGFDQTTCSDRPPAV